MLKTENFFVTEASIEKIDELIHLFDAYRVFYGQKSNLETAKSFIQDRFEDDSVILVAVCRKN